jgi:hypothetical protein
MATGGWFPKTNFALVALLKKIFAVVSKRHTIKLSWVKGRSKVTGNELADRAADAGRTSSLPLGGRFEAPGIPSVDHLRVIELLTDHALLSKDLALQHIIAKAASHTFDPITRVARKPWITAQTLDLIDKVAWACAVGGNHEQEQKLAKQVKKSARRDTANHTKKTMAEAAHDRTGKLLYDSIKSIKKGFTSKKLCLTKNGMPQPLD